VCLSSILVVWSHAIHSSKLPFCLSSIGEIHKDNGMIFFFDAAFGALVLFFLFSGRKYYSGQKASREISERFFLSSLLETMEDGFVTLDGQGKILTFNPAAEKIFGYEEAEIIGEEVGVLIPNSLSRDNNIFGGNKDSKQEKIVLGKVGREVVGKHKNGNVFLLSITVSVMYFQGVRLFSGVIRDITEAKSAQALAIRTAEELTQFVDTANAPIFGIDSNGLVNEWNQTAEKITGFSKVEVLGKDLVAEFITDEYKAPVKQVLDNALHGEQRANYEFPLYTKTGQRVDVLLNATTRRDVEGTITGVIGVGQDITEAKSAQALAIRTAEELTQFVDTANAPIFGIDSNGLVNEWNQTAEKITGFSKAEVLGKDLVAEFITDEYKAPVKQVLDNALHGDQRANYEFPLYTKTGQRVDVLLNATTRRDVEGTITGVIGVGQDITELRKNEKALSQSRKMETVGQLTGGIAHDFNNLLSIIGGNLRFLKQDLGEVSQEVEELFEDAMSATSDGADLTARLLSFSRNRTLRPECKEVNETIETFSRFISRTLGNAVDLVTELPRHDLFINVDTSQLENALLNLAINSRDAMPDGGIITIRAERYSQSIATEGNTSEIYEDLSLPHGNYVLVTVSDTGVGISNDDLPRVYEPFFTTKEVGKGSGLGLSMVYGFVQQSNGYCLVQSKLGEGTKIFMCFPEVRNFAQNVTSGAEGNSPIEGSETILVVEDEPRVRRVTLRDLQKLGYRTLEAENGEMAKAIIDSVEHIDLVFSDVLMPGITDGQMLGVWIKKNHPNVGVILTSGFTKRKTETEEEGTNFPLIRKPYTIEALSKQIRETMHKSP